jgi:uncharacterized protein with HEPN domain
MHPEDWRNYLNDIQVSISRIFSYTEEFDFDEFANDQKTIDAVVKNFEIIGEATTALTLEFRSEHNDIPWRSMINMRNRLVHSYLDIDIEVVWKTISEDLPQLESYIQRLIETQDDQQTSE